MSSWQHGLVIGKFYPPHNGHLHLINEAAKSCERVTVIVMAADYESISLADRVQWIEAECAHLEAVRIVGVTDNIPVDYEDAVIWDGHVSLMQAALMLTMTDAMTSSDYLIDVVFTSENYGDELARRFGADAVCVNLERTELAVSGTAVRADVPGNWSLLPATVRDGLALRVVVVGSESTGTTTVARELARRLRARGGIWERTKWVPEFGREYTVKKLAAASAFSLRAGGEEPGMDDVVWTPEEFAFIALQQRRSEILANADGSPVLVCDTDAFATGVWFTRYVGGRSAAVEELGEQGSADLYLLTDHVGVPFEQDRIRDGEHLREWMTAEFATRLDDASKDWIMLSGALAERLERAEREVDRLLAGAWQFADSAS